MVRVAHPRRRSERSGQTSSGGVVIAGAGPAGLACAYGLAREGRPALVVDKDARAGGLGQTIDFHGYLFDIGGHRFLSRFDEVTRLWKDLLGDDLLRVRRISRIFYRGRFFKYPLSFFDTFWNLGPVDSILCVGSYLRDRVSQPGDDSTFEGWIINRFGRRLYEIFFNVYTQKVWAIPCRDLSADWAKQRIQGLSLRVALRKAVLRTKFGGPKTLAEEFLYPRRGPGQFFDRLQEAAEKGGARFLFRRSVSVVRHDGRRILALDLAGGGPAGPRRVLPSHLVSTLPLPALVKSLRPHAPRPVLDAAETLRFRSFLVVNLILKGRNLFPDQWIYVHSPEVRLGRVQNYKNWSPAMTLDPDKTSLGLEYFCDEGDDLWRMNNIELIDFAVEELARLRIAARKNLISGFVVRRPDVYPVYSLDYQKSLRTIQVFLARFENLQTVGRAGLFRYCNSDLALLMGLRAAEAIRGIRIPDLWTLGRKEGYLEE
jgi:protoporphyrinogen oxidase